MDKKTRFIQVQNEEAAIVQAANEIETRANEQATQREEVASKEHGKILTDPMRFFGSEENAEIVRRRDEIQKEYQTKYELPYPPILIPAIPPSPAPTPQRAFETRGTSQSGVPYRERQGPPLPEELKERFLKFVPTFRKGERLRMWEGNHYRCLTKNEAQARIKTVLRAECYIPNPSALLSGIYKMLTTEEAIAGEPDCYPFLVAVQNGEVDLRTMRLGPASPAHHLVHYLDVPWEGPQPCPVFSAFLDQVSGGDPELRQRIVEAIGYLLVPDYGAKKFVVFQGPGDSGKSVLGNLVASFFLPGDFASLTDFQFGERFALSSIANCQLCLSMDLADGVIDGKAVSVLKQITGGDALSIEGKGKDAYTDYIRCKLLFGTNNPIRLKSRDHAFANRVLLVPFFYPVPPERQDRGLLEKLKAERPAILYQALHAYHAVMDRGYQFTGEVRFGFTPSHIVLEENSANTMETFVTRCCELDKEVFTSSEALHNAYISFCDQVGCPAIADRASFSRALNACLCGKLRQDKKRVNGVPTNGYWGIKLKGEDIYV